MKLAERITEEFKERVLDEDVKEIDYEMSWAILNGLVISYLKAKGEHSLYKEEALKEGVRKVILSLPKYDMYYAGKYKLNKQDKEYFALCPAELVDGLSYSKINADMVMAIAQKVVDFSAENGFKEDGKLRIADGGVAKASMDEFEELNSVMISMKGSILETRGEEGLKVAMAYYQGLAEKAVKDEIDFHADNANYIVKFYASILHHAKEDEENASSIA